MRDVLFDLLIALGPTVLLPAFLWLLSSLVAWLKTKTKAEWLKALEERGGQVAKDAVLASFQTLVAEAKKAKDPSSPGGASITKEEGLKIFRSTLLSAKGALGSFFILGAEEALGAGVVTENLTAKIEAAVLASKATGLDKVGLEAPPKKEAPAVPLAVA
jgi:hypothetical protein